jgi:hypothetical protein
MINFPAGEMLKRPKLVPLVFQASTKSAIFMVILCAPGVHTCDKFTDDKTGDGLFPTRRSTAARAVHGPFACSMHVNVIMPGFVTQRFDLHS